MLFELDVFNKYSPKLPEIFVLLSMGPVTKCWLKAVLNLPLYVLVSFSDQTAIWWTNIFTITHNSFLNNLHGCPISDEI